MAAKFTVGTNLKTTHSTAQSNKVPPPQANSMKGLPGFIKTKQDASDGGLVSGKKGPGPHREGPIGKKGGSGNVRFQSAKFRGPSDKSYRGTSFAPPGTVASNKNQPHTRGKSEKERPKRGEHGGFRQQTVKDARLPVQGASRNVGGHPGRMETLRGKARTSWER